jgi:hypothetical protein
VNSPSPFTYDSSFNSIEFSLSNSDQSRRFAPPGFFGRNRNFFELEASTSGMSTQSVRRRGSFSDTTVLEGGQEEQMLQELTQREQTLQEHLLRVQTWKAQVMMRRQQVPQVQTRHAQIRILSPRVQAQTPRLPLMNEEPMPPPHFQAQTPSQTPPPPFQAQQVPQASLEEEPMPPPQTPSQTPPPHFQAQQVPQASLEEEPMPPPQTPSQTPPPQTPSQTPPPHFQAQQVPQASLEEEPTQPQEEEEQMQPEEDGGIPQAPLPENGPMPMEVKTTEEQVQAELEQLLVRCLLEKKPGPMELLVRKLKPLPGRFVPTNYAVLQVNAQRHYHM